MKEEFGYELHFIPAVPFRFALLKGFLSYPLQALRTLLLLLKMQPQIIWIQLPPSFLAHTICLARLLLKERIVVIADLHNSALSKRWRSVPLTRRALNSFEVILVHNEPTRQAALQLGFEPERLLVLEDRLPSFADAGDGMEDVEPGLFVVPCSFNRDEPIPNVIDAARSLPDFRFMLTGDRAKAERLGYLADVPDNVTLTGFLPALDYEKLLGRAAGVLCLTTEDGIQLSAAAEAVGSGKPMIISNTPLLQTLFPSGVFVDNSAPSIATACRRVGADYETFAAATRRARADFDRQQRWQSQALRIRDLMMQRT